MDTMNNNKNRYEFPSDIVEQLLCSHCNCYMSIGPIMMQLDGRSICGRCSSSSSEVDVRNVLFETAMSQFTFPCRYKLQGCKETVLFGYSTTQHEDMCPYKTFLCPSLPNGVCPENLSGFDVYKHFNENHLDLITKDGRFKLNVEQNFQVNLLMMVNKITVIIECHYDKPKNILYLNVGHFSYDNSQLLCYKTQITSGSDADRIIHFKEFPCYCYQSQTIIDQNATHLMMSNYLPALDNPSFIFINIMITIQNKDSSGTVNGIESVIESQTVSLVASAIQNQTEKHEKIVEEALNALEEVRCFYCKYYIIPPIFSGDDDKILSCSTCKENLSSPKQIECTQSVYPCRWRACTFIGNQANIAEHEQDCPYQNFFCPIKSCQKNYVALNNLMEHLGSHGTYCPDPQRVVIKLYCDKLLSPDDDPVTKFYFTLFEKKILTFKCIVSGVGSWELSGIGCEGFDIGFCFEHDHCRVKTEKDYQSDSFSLKHSDAEVQKMFPPCFQMCPRNEAILEILNQQDD